jgi:uncharacterized repeat protein (TIGR01451 family)
MRDDVAIVTPSDARRHLRRELMMKRIRNSLLALNVAWAACGYAAENGDLVAVLEVKKVVSNGDGTEFMVPGDSAKPGDILQYSAIYRNQGKKSVKKVEATIPIPDGTEYLPSSAKPSGARASADGQSFQVIPLRRKVKGPDGKEQAQLISYGEYRFLRWYPGDLAPGKEARFVLRARVLADESAAGPPAGAADASGGKN